MVELGTPVNGATVEAYQFSGLSKGEKVGEAVSNRDGTFSLSFKTGFDGPLLLLAKGGTYRDLATGEVVALKPAQELTSAITHIKMPEKTNINAWTTLAVARVKADRGFWDKSIAELKDMDRINVDFTQMSYFLAGRSTQFINIRQQEFLDIEKDTFNLDEPKMTLHLAHGGLSQLAKNFSFMLVQDGIVVSIVDLVLALADDLSDRIFDGRNVTGNIVYVGNNHRINLDSYTMRKQLGEAILVYSKQLQEGGKIIEKDIMAPGRLIDSLVKDTRPEFFLERDNLLPLDLEPPILDIKFAGDHTINDPFPVLDGEVYFNVIAHDDSVVTELKVIVPALESQVGLGNFGPITINHTQDAKEIAKVCGKKDEFLTQLKEKNLKQENVICACFTATDMVKNTKRELACFQRSIPKALIEFPTNNVVLNTKSFANGVKAKAVITSGMPLTHCTWAIVDRNNTEAHRTRLPKGQGKINGNSCTINEALFPNIIPDGSYYFAIDAKDIGGRTLSDNTNIANENFSKFRVAKAP
jgi:hypothetical protein